MFFASAQDLRDWLEQHHESADELWVAIHPNDSLRSGITPGEALDEALRFGWVNNLNWRLDEQRYMLRFIPRDPGSAWSPRDTARAKELRAGGHMYEPGIRAFELRRDRMSS
jgi:uncharacterized protein YdeI (YjbR/CyaY-like superfamily)